MMINYTKFAEMHSKYGIKLLDPISPELLNKLPDKSQILDVVWAINAANQKNKSPINLGLTVMKEIRDRADMLLSHKAFKNYGGDKEKLKDYADRHYKVEPSHTDKMFKGRQEKIMKNLGLIKDIDRLIINEKQKTSESSDGEIPTEEEIKAIYREIAKPGEEVFENRLKEAVRKIFDRQGRKLRSDWWNITKRNLVEWSKKR